MSGQDGLRRAAPWALCAIALVLLALGSWLRWLLPSVRLAARAVDAFAARLRDQVNLDQITTGLRDTVAATVAPGSVTVWLRSGDRS